MTNELILSALILAAALVAGIALGAHPVMIGFVVTGICLLGVLMLIGERSNESG